MRWFICAVVLLALTPRAFADDLDILRGTESVGAATFPRWSGFYFGGDAAYGGSNVNFSNATQAPLAYALRDTVVESQFQPSSWQVLGSATAQTTFFGAFLGYNTQWQDVVIGGELTYARPNFSVTASSSPLARSFTYTDPTTQSETLYDLGAAGSGTLHLVDYGTVRARAGWIVGNNFLPYGFAGFALGRADYTLAASVGGPTASTVQTLVGSTPFTPTPVLPCVPSTPETCSSFSESSQTSGDPAWLYGIDAGLGVDIALMQNVFLRGELEYVHFFPYKGITVDFAAARVGAGLKF